jgi:hypothetical protein
MFPEISCTDITELVCYFFFFSIALPAHSGPRPLIQFRNHFSQAVGLLGRVISPSQGLYLTQGNTHTEWTHTHTHTHTHQISMPWLGFEPTIPASKRVKTVHALDRAATVTGPTCYYPRIIGWIVESTNSLVKHHNKHDISLNITITT